ncbi:MAG TPA: NADH:flavin oxidoreductase/NADH oxidase [Casimicrobiaceae bacterium]|nr:NADH:flavin oxidoreductase/NADH oxidase [Casimicrobiaceae bacterium]
MHLFDPMPLRGLELRNRIVVSPMCQYSAERGCATDWHLVHWGQMLLSGAGMFTIEATAVTAEGRITHGCLGLYDDATEEALGSTLARARRQAPLMPVAIQLAHAGRKASSALPWKGGKLIPLAQGGWTPVAPSAIAHADGEHAPTALDASGLAAIRDAFVTTAQRAERCGVDAIELHMAHGYLLHEFLSPIANRRSDAYGGSFANRIRFPLEVFDAVRAAWRADRPLGVRISATDWVDGGWSLDESIELARELKARRCDWIDVSAGGVSPAQKIPAPTPGVHVPFAREIRRATGVTTITVGLVTDPKHADSIIAAGDADMVALARAMLRDPRWPWRAAAALGGTVAEVPQYGRSLTKDMAAIFEGFAVAQR